MIITSTVVPIEKLISVVQLHAKQTFVFGGIQRTSTDDAVQEALEPFLARLRNDLFVCVESPYIDEVYRDNYYNYYAAKRESYPKDCVRLSFFKGPIESTDFRDAARRSHLENSYAGFLVLRPTLRNIIGRNVLNPAAFQEPIGEICQATFATTVNSIKLTVNGFPHSSQDAETMTCAQTTLWAIMEYFSQRYQVYQPVLPSTITNQLEPVTFERLMPAIGLHVHHISYVLRGFGFGPRIYTRVAYGSDFTDLFSCYVESGIPIVVSIENKADKTNHAVLCIGRKNLDSRHLAHYLEKSDIVPEQSTPPVYDLDQSPKEYVFIDDNLPPYSRATFGNGQTSFTRMDGREYEVTAFVVPLHQKVYLDAVNAKKYVKTLLSEGIIALADYENVIIKFFLTSSRSYKDRIASDPIMQSELKQVITSALLPEFIWVGELSTPKFFQQNKACGVVLLDATEADTKKHKPLIIAAFPNKILNFAAVSSSEGTLNIVVKPFTMYQNNLT